MTREKNFLETPIPDIFESHKPRLSLLTLLINTKNHKIHTKTPSSDGGGVELLVRESEDRGSNPSTKVSR